MLFIKKPNTAIYLLRCFLDKHKNIILQKITQDLIKKNIYDNKNLIFYVAKTKEG